MMIPSPTMPTKVARSLGFSTRRRMMISGSDNPTTAIMNASVVPSGNPLAQSACTIGMMPSELE